LPVYRVWPERILAFPMTLPIACHPYAVNANMVNIRCGNVSGETVVIIVYDVSSRYTKVEQWV